jgi:hypothetical protein
MHDKVAENPVIKFASIAVGNKLELQRAKTMQNQEDLEHLYLNVDIPTR